MDVFASKLSSQISEEAALEGDLPPRLRRRALCLAGWTPRVRLVGSPAGPASCGLHTAVVSEWLIKHPWHSQDNPPKGSNSECWVSLAKNIIYLVFSALHTTLVLFLLSLPSLMAPSPPLLLSCIFASGRCQSTTFTTGGLSLHMAAVTSVKRYCW